VVMNGGFVVVWLLPFYTRGEEDYKGGWDDDDVDNKDDEGHYEMLMMRDRNNTLTQALSSTGTAGLFLLVVVVLGILLGRCSFL